MEVESWVCWGAARSPHAPFSPRSAGRTLHRRLPALKSSTSPRGLGNGIATFGAAMYEYTCMNPHPVTNPTESTFIPMRSPTPVQRPCSPCSRLKNPPWRIRAKTNKQKPTRPSRFPSTATVKKKRKKEKNHLHLPHKPAPRPPVQHRPSTQQTSHSPPIRSPHAPTRLGSPFLHPPAKQPRVGIESFLSALRCLAPAHTFRSHAPPPPPKNPPRPLTLLSPSRRVSHEHLTHKYYPLPRVY